MAATHWRTIRTRMRADGIADPMRQLPHMHALVDEAEKVWLEVLHTGNEAKDKNARDQLLDRLYAPTAAGAAELNGEGYEAKTAPPAGFEDPAQVEADFDAVAKMLAGG
ncbi:hypothetical protein [Mycobacteroides chelonae]|uniref:DUF7240 domain-containing protein n=1 Tax=Mycobacteroides chelonae TaxID=1774 RepID=UPI001F310369|nr:hypothetical protein [Mycobacteroides chelonae]